MYIWIPVQPVHAVAPSPDKPPPLTQRRPPPHKKLALRREGNVGEMSEAGQNVKVSIRETRLMALVVQTICLSPGHDECA
jgi:hypothetical protein